MNNQEEAIKFVQQILIQFEKEILGAFHKQIKFHNNEIALLKEKISNHNQKINVIIKQEKTFKWLSKQAKMPKME